MTDMLTLPKFEKAIGPYVSDITNSEKFIENSKAIYGPFIKDERWYCIKSRRFVEIKDVIDDFAHLHFDIKYEVFVEQDIIKLYTKNTEIMPYFTDFFYPRENFCNLAGLGGFEPPSAGPKPAALSRLCYKPIYKNILSIIFIV